MTTLRAFASIIVLHAGGLAQTQVAPGSAAAPRGDTIGKARALLATEVAAKVPGASVAVAANGIVVWSENFGYADLAKRQRVTARTRFRIGSVSKPLAAAGLALLVERGQVDLDAPIQAYIADYPRTDVPITLRLLAGHLSGIRSPRPDETLSTVAYPNARSRLAVFENDPLHALPGTAFKYSSYNWNVIEAAIERVSRQSFVAFMERNVLGPLQLANTRAEQTGTVDADQSLSYEADESGAFILGPRIDVTHAWAAGGYLSTPEDLVRFGSALLHSRFLKESSRQLLFTSQTTRAGISTGYGLGWNIHPQPKVIFHSGWTVGGLSILLLLPEAGTVVAIATNRGGLYVREDHRLYFNIEEVGYKLARIFDENPSR